MVKYNSTSKEVGLHNLIYTYNVYQIWSSTQVGDGHLSRALPVADEASVKWRSGRNLSALQAGINFGQPQEGT